MRSNGHRGPVWAVVVAGGSGTRFGRPKQFADLAGRPVVAWAVAAARAAVDGVVLVLPADQLPVAPADRFGADRIVAGGASRSASVRCGLAAVPADADVVVVHDAARPLAGPELFVAVLDALADGVAGGAICAVPVADTLKRVAPDPSTPHRAAVTGTVDRDDLVAVQTPQAFPADVLRRAHATAGEATDDAGLVEALGATVRVVAGHPDNLKLTTPADLAYAEHLVKGR
ncbi:MAG TPA: 2-C-methyl-D-erythritol 4-phosphate cytidylyltransferase [Acidimicrobiales bacterium]|nr:2-C-methyl-D-erythritol 4-phosphate cytidylyltransferase [Acidimicrobiales bacterium]